MTGKREAPTRRRTERQGAEDRATRPNRSGPRTNPARRQGPASSTSQAKARAKARKAKAPKAVRVPLRERLISRLTSIELDPRTLVKKVPFVVLVIGSLGIGLALTLWLSTDSAERSYELSNARERNRVLGEQKESLERQVLEAQAAPALAEAARNLGMIPSRDAAHLVQDASGNWVVVGDPRPAEGSPPPPLNTALPDPNAPVAAPVNRTEVPVLVTNPAAASATPTLAPGALPQTGNPEVLIRTPVPSAVAAAPVPAEAPTPAAATPTPAAATPTPAETAPAPDPLGEPVVPSGPLSAPAEAAPAAVPTTVPPA